MKIPHYQELKQRTDSALKVGREPKKTILAYAGIITVMGLLVCILTVLLDGQIANTGGLANMGSRSILSTVQTLLPLAQSVLLMCLEMGYISAAMRLSRKQYADHMELRSGFRLFPPALRLSLLQMIIYFSILMLVTTLVVNLNITLPFLVPLLEALVPIKESFTFYENLTAVSIMMLLGWILTALVLFALIAIPLSYRYRMANYCLVDQPRAGAIAALRSSWRMMRGNCFRLFKVDLHFWYYYLATFLASFICYGDQFLPLVGIQLPISETVAYILFYAIYLGIQFFLYYRFRNRVEMTYVAAYDALRPQEDTGGVVLGNIFDMA